MPSRAQKSVVGRVPNENGPVARPDSGGTQTSHAAESSASDNHVKLSPDTDQKRKYKHVQLFAFDSDAAEGATASRDGGRPKRKLKAIARFESMSFDKASQCKIGEGFSCPRCSAVCSYDSRACDECQLECCYEAGIGVVVLKERRVSLEQYKHSGKVSQEISSRGGVAESAIDHARGNNLHQMDNVEGNERKISSLIVGHSHPTDKNDTHIPAEPAGGFPDGWVVRRFPRGTGKRHDSYFYSPKKRFKFRSRTGVQHFLDILVRTNGDESDAISLFANHIGHRRRSSAGRAIPNSHAIVDQEAAATLVGLAKEKGGNSSSELEANEGTECEVMEVCIQATNGAKVGAMQNQAVGNTSSPNKTGSCRSPPPGIRVQLYQDELQSALNCVETQAVTDSNALSSQHVPINYKRNNGMANLLREKDAALERAHSIISALRQAQKSKDPENKRLERQLVDAKNDIAQLTQENTIFESKLTDAIRQKEKQATELQETAKSLQIITEENSNLTNQLSELQAKNDSALSDSANTERELRETISNLEVAIQETKHSSVQVSDTLSIVRHERDELGKKMETATADLSALQQELLNKSETACTEIQTLKKQASKRMSQVYTLTDQLSVALNEKAEFETKLESAAANLSKMQMEATSQATMGSELQSSSHTSQCHVANSQIAKLSSVEGGHFTRLEAEKAEAIAKSKSLAATVDELQSQMELLSAELNASRSVNNGLKAKCDKIETTHNECINELERVINKKDRCPPGVEDCKTTIRKLEQSVYQQNKEIQALHEAVSASDHQAVDLIAQVSSLTTERNEMKAKAEEAAGKVARFQSSADGLKTQSDTVKAREREQPNVSTSEKSLSVITLSEISADKEALVTKAGLCTTLLDSEMELMQLKINELKAQLTGSEIQCPERNCVNGSKMNMLHLEVNEGLSKEDAKLSRLRGEFESLEARMKKALKMFKEEHLRTTEDCKTNLKQKRKLIRTLKADIANTTANQKENSCFSSKNERSATLPAGRVSATGASRFIHEEVDGIAGDALDENKDASTNVQLFSFDAQEEYNWSRPKRKLKAIARFESLSFDSKKTSRCKVGEGFSCPRCSAVCSYDSKECDECHLKCYYEAGIGVVVLKDRNVAAEKNAHICHPTGENASQQNKSKFILCHCPDCDKRDLTMKGLLLHYANEHGGKPQWKKIKYSCPFCPSASRDYKSLDEVEVHVNASHPGRRFLKPNTSTKRQKSQLGLISEKITAERGAANQKKQGRPSCAWSKLEFHKLLPDGGTKYPQELPNAIEFIDAQCRKQEQNVEIARGDWKNEMEGKELDDERTIYRRGIRERSSLSDQEKLEKMRFMEKTEDMMRRYGDRRRNKDKIEAAKLCSLQIVFSDHHKTHIDGIAGACMNDDCQFCKKDSILYRQELLPENEINKFKPGATCTESPLIQTAKNVLNPAFGLFDEGRAKDGSNPGGAERDDRVKVMKVEEGKLERLKKTKHSLEFIKRYNDGYLTNAWGGRKST